EGARPHRLHGGLERAEAADQHDLRRGAGLLEGLEHVEPRRRPIQVDVRDHKLELILVRQLHRFRGGLALLELPPRRRHQLRDQPAGLDVVVDDQDANRMGRRGHDTSTADAAAGSSMVKVVPRPFDVTHGSKMRGRTAESIPPPVSRTAMRTRPSSVAAASVSVPPSGIASSALVTRLSSASSSCDSSAATLPSGCCRSRSSVTPLVASLARMASPMREMTESMRTG